MVEGKTGLERFNAILEDVKRVCEEGNAPWIPEVILKYTHVFVPDVYKKLKLTYCEAHPDVYRLYMILGITVVMLKVENEEKYKGVTLYIWHPVFDVERIIFGCNRIAGKWNC